MGIPEYEAKRYEGRVKEGGVLLSVHCQTADKVNRAKDLLKHTGAQDIASTSEASADQPAEKAIPAAQLAHIENVGAENYFRIAV